MSTALTQFLISAVVIVGAAVTLTRCADTIAELTRLGRLLIGSVLLAASTSLPELTIDLNAIWLHMPDVAVGDLAGSSLFNLLILAIADMAHRKRGVMFSRSALAHTLPGTLSITLTAIVALAIEVERDFSGWTFAGLGPGAIAVVCAYLLGMRLVYYDQRHVQAQIELKQAPSSDGRSLSSAFAGYVVAAAMIFLAAPPLARAAGSLAEMTGLGQTFIGTTLVALSTSLPELVTTIAAVRLGSIDLAIGNVFGSNTFNMLLIVPLDLAFPGSLLASVASTHIVTCLAVVLITSVVILGQLYQVERRILFIEPDAALVIGLMIGALLLIYAMS